jgi:hypothetical protein
MKPVINTKPVISLYWKCQFAFWLAADVQWSLMGYTGPGFSWRLAIIHVVADLLIYIPLSHLYRQISKKLQWHTLSIGQLLVRILPALIILGVAFMVLTTGKNYLVRVWFYKGYHGSFSGMFYANGLAVFLGGIRLMAVWLLAYYAWHYAQREIRAVKEAARLEIMAKDAAFNHLTAQLNPHFFFNALNSIKALVIEDPKAARRAIDVLGDLLRTSLYANKGTLVPLKNEMALVKDYLELEKIRFEEKLQASFETDERLMDTNILPLSIQILVENAIKHGIVKSRQGGFIKIKIERYNGCISTAVENTGKLDGVARKGLGLHNLAERLKLQFGDKAFFSLVQQTDETVLATLTMPVS